VNSRNPAFLLALVLAAGPLLAGEDAGIGPWQIGMSKEQVVAFGDFAPYEAVQAGGELATEKAKFSGHKVKASFAFGDAGLRAVEVLNYEGKEWSRARDAALEVYDHFASAYGGANVKDTADKISRKELENILDRTLGTAQEMNKRYAGNGSGMIMTFDMTPMRQPADSRLHCQWVYIGKSNTFFVYLYVDRPGSPPRDTRDSIEIEKL
jgi:hypothetical protein